VSRQSSHHRIHSCLTLPPLLHLVARRCFVLTRGSRSLATAVSCAMFVPSKGRSVPDPLCLVSLVAGEPFGAHQVRPWLHSRQPPHPTCKYRLPNTGTQERGRTTSCCGRFVSRCSRLLLVRHAVLSCSLFVTLFSPAFCLSRSSTLLLVCHAVLSCPLSATLFSPAPCLSRCSLLPLVCHAVLSCSLSVTLFSPGLAAPGLLGLLCALPSGCRSPPPCR
jgi:hypothetical protein